MCEPNTCHVVGAHNVHPLPLFIRSVQRVNNRSFQVTAEATLHIFNFGFAKLLTSITIPAIFRDLTLKLSAVATLVDRNITLVTNYQMVGYDTILVFLDNVIQANIADYVLV